MGYGGVTKMGLVVGDVTQRSREGVGGSGKKASIEVCMWNSCVEYQPNVKVRVKYENRKLGNQSVSKSKLTV